MPGAEDRLSEIKDALMDIWAPAGKPIGGLKAVTNHEPLAAPNLPLLTMMTRGFRRRALETPDIDAQRMRDPLGGRIWEWKLWIRVWVALVSDAAAAQDELDVLIPQVVVALEDDRTLGGIAVDAAMSSGDAAIVRPQQGQPTLMLTCDLAVETEEILN